MFTKESNKVVKVEIQYEETPTEFCWDVASTKLLNCSDTAEFTGLNTAQEMFAQSLMKR